jgi:hypothetical protein
MNKLKLHLDDLAVESFDTCGLEREKGTVVGEQVPCSCAGTCPATACASCAYTCDDATCVYTCDDPSCAESCNGTCDGYTCLDSCGGTCWNPRCNPSAICP